MAVALVMALAWPLVALVALGCAVWAFESWRHPTIAEQMLKALTESNLELAQRVGQLELAAGVKQVRHQVRRATGIGSQ